MFPLLTCCVLPYLVVVVVTRPLPRDGGMAEDHGAPASEARQLPRAWTRGRNGCWPFRGSQIPRALPFIFSLCCPLNDRRRAAHSFFKIGRLFSLFSCHFLAGLRLFILLLMSGSVHPNPGPIFLCSVCAGNVTWQSKSV